MEFGEHFKNLSEETVDRVARGLGVSKTTVKRWGQGTVIPHRLVQPHALKALDRAKLDLTVGRSVAERQNL